MKIGIVGAGGFARFAAEAFSLIPEVRITGVFDAVPAAAQWFGEQYHAEILNHLSALIHSPVVELVYIATPPYLHYPQSKEALLAGKHVICEKPAAFRVQEAEDLVAIAEDRKLLYAINLMQRYNPMVHQVDELIREEILGKFLHGFFENYAADQQLSRGHWFWDNEKSGGIFIEHGVHFFDLFSGWLGEGKLINAFALPRPGVKENIYDRVQATVEYKDGPVTHYHGFNQPHVLDRQELRLQFERGEITLEEWIPVKLTLHGLVTPEKKQQLLNLFPGCAIDIRSTAPETVHVNGNWKDIDYHEEITLTLGRREDKMKRYRELVMAMLKDQLAWIRDPGHPRVITAQNAITSTKIAEMATKAAGL